MVDLQRLLQLPSVLLQRGELQLEPLRCVCVCVCVRYINIVLSLLSAGRGLG